ncbi:protein-associating with the carboxyl-terminal domain of ezrin [Anoplophora glabripennis]|uniref:protein-associating with the carboxyl-terminal domain of ezrin n=1 Tax=Anoplophora glabripennis TaxID=217634 RepID=UPI000873E620|nr:protein-associating with the carboxyl-terminal domain of ezrin [Anoplophora glabripennis]
MGNDQSQLPGIEIEEKAVEVSDFWTQHSACILNSEIVTNLSVFIGELFIDGSLWAVQTPLEKNSKILMIYRHPCIIKYVSSWQKNSKYYLAVEEVTPLAHILPTLNTLQICIGLHSILKALHFLHEKTSSSHNNICVASIYVTKSGSWKLGGMEYLCKYKDLDQDYLNKSRTNRYDKAIDTNEDKLLLNINKQKDFIDVYAFGVLACEVLKSKGNSDDIPNLSSFCEYCHKELQNSNISQRPKLSSILEHDFFNHEFITIHSFLIELPLKSDEEKTLFFRSLKDKLKSFNEVVVASQLSSLLLSRMVLLNITAQEFLLPFLLTPHPDQEAHSELLFSEDTFKKYVSPKLLEIISVRDAQIRLLLLTHFLSFMHIFSKEELQTCILPELLVGIKDTNDHLVAVTLRTLADLVPVLGAATVIGGKRAKLFNDGRPITHSSKRLLKVVSKPREIEQPAPTPEVLQNQISVNSLAIEPNNVITLPERSRPDGEEGETSTEEVEQSIDEDLDNWEDWDINENNPSSNNLLNTIEDNTHSTEYVPENLNQNILNEVIETDSTVSQQSVEKSKRTIPDIGELDIKNQLNRNENDDFDFFQDMEPVINATNKFLINESDSDIIFSIDKEFSSKLTLNDNDIHEEGWGDGDWE